MRWWPPNYTIGLWLGDALPPAEGLTVPHEKVAIVVRGHFKPLRGRQGPGVTEYTILLAALVFGSTTAIGTVGGSFSAMCQNTSGIVAALNGPGSPHLAVRRSTKLALRDKTITGWDVKSDSRVTCRGAGAGSADHWALDK